VVLSGMSNMEQVEDNTSYMKDFQPLSDVEQDAVKQVAAALRSKITVDCTACGACLEQCPQHIPMPAYFDMYNEHCQMNKYTNGMVYYANFPRRNRQGVRLRWLWKVRGGVPPKAAHPGAAERSQGRV